MKEKKSNKLPKSAMALYVKIYCQKQGKIKNKQYSLAEATKSWVSLSKTDKQYFQSVYKEYETKMKKYLALNLQNAELYMRRKCVPERLNKSKTPNIEFTETFEDARTHAENSYSLCNNKDENNEIENVHDNVLLENTTTLVENVACVNTESDSERFISEPIPPVRTSMELFEIIKHNEESTRNLTWSELTKLQKHRYLRALLRIKKDYLKQYTEYLEQLTPEQLFHYYKSKI